jgi:hypothetical protein
MTYAILQRELVTPELERLKRVFSLRPEFTSLDAATVAGDAYGILLRGLDLEQADAIQTALMREGIDAVVEEEPKLPTLAPGRIGRQAELDTRHLTLYDPMRRAVAVAWADMSFISAGLVKTGEPRKPRPGLEAPVSKEELHRHLMLEIFLRDGAGRFSIDGDEFDYAHLGQKLSTDPAVNFVFLVQQLAQNAPHAGLNRGACAAQKKPPELFLYPSKQAFHEELVWMLWRISRPA